ncbi:myeloid zinc finger 1 [Amia ocellicauda]|uniref:myeloid zinc finger 1 n=1 Tax=Amia ocellicauda TaxID=2972642 RepID=UPI003464016F
MMEACVLSIKEEGEESLCGGAREGQQVTVKEEEESEKSEINGEETPQKVSLQCRECGRSFRGARAKERHLRRCHPEEYQEQVLSGSRLTCHLCHLPCRSSRELIEHQRAEHTQGRPFQCPVCGDSFVQSHALINHKRRHLRQSSYACRDCSLTCRSLKQLLSHRRHHNSPPTPPDPPSLPCPPPSPPTPTQPSTDSPSNPLLSLQCLHCFITFRDAETSEKHLRFKHPVEYERLLRGRTVFACRRCDRTFPSSAQLSTHQRAHGNWSLTLASSSSLIPLSSSPPAGSEDTLQVERGRLGEEEEEEAQSQSQPQPHCGSLALMPTHAPQPYKCPHCNFLFRDVNTQLRHMHAKHPPGCSAPPSMLFPDQDGEEEEVVRVQIKEEPEEEEEEEEQGKGEDVQPTSPYSSVHCETPPHTLRSPGPAEPEGEDGEVVRVQIKAEEEEEVEDEEEEEEEEEEEGEREQLPPEEGMGKQYSMV